MPKKFRKPATSEVYEFLAKHNALIVHFSGTPKGSGSQYTHEFPTDLNWVISGHAMGGVSSSVVLPGDEFANLAKANATGCIGTILGMTSPSSLVAVHPHDCGSIEENGMRKVPNERDILISDLEESLTARHPDSYNEWVVRDFRVLGVLAMPPGRVSTVVIPDYPPDMPEYLRTGVPVPGFRRVQDAELFRIFKGSSIFRFRRKGLVRLSEKGEISVMHSEIYREQ